VLYV
jgi:hypothetical protein